MSTSTPLATLGRAEDVRAEDVRAEDSPDQEEHRAREIIVGVDGSDCALAAVRWAAQEAARRHAPLRILHAATYLGRGGPDGASPPELSHARRITAQAYTVARHTEPSVAADTEIVAGDPATVLLKAAAGGQLVVLGSSATGALDEWVRAPVAMQLAARSPRPVVVVPRRRGGEPTGRPAVAVLGVGERGDDEAVAIFAAAAAQRSGVSLSVLQTRPAQDHPSAGWVDDPAGWAQRFPGLEVSLGELHAARAYQVLGATCPSPLLTISAGHGSLLHRTLDGPHRWLLRHCTSPMALLPPVDRFERHPREEAAPLR